MGKNQLKYLVKWKGYGYEHDSWVPERDMVVKDLVSKFHQDHLNAPHHIWQTAFQLLAFQQLWRLSSVPGTTHLEGGLCQGTNHFTHQSPW